MLVQSYTVNKVKGRWGNLTAFLFECVLGVVLVDECCPGAKALGLFYFWGLMDMTFYDQLRNAAVALGANWNTAAGAINLVGVRNTRDLNSNKFNDLICVAYQTAARGHFVLICEATTDPGVYWRENLANVNGSAVLIRGHHKRMWKIGKHRGQYTALVQASPVTVWRDANRDREINVGVAAQTGMFGINLHRAGEFVDSKLVDKWSAGCQVVASPKQFIQLMDLAQHHSAQFGNSFDYTLLDDVDVGLDWGAVSAV